MALSFAFVGIRLSRTRRGPVYDPSTELNEIILMAGDTFNVRVNSWYDMHGTSPGTLVSPLTDIITAMISGVSGSAALNTHGVTSGGLSGSGAFSNVSDLLTDQSGHADPAKPKAFLNWVLFDEQFKYVSAGSGFEQVGDDGVTTAMVHTDMPIGTSGYLYIYVSNETPNIDVYFDDLQVTHHRGPLLETNEYYPYGMAMKNISYRSAGAMANRYKSNGGSEHEDEGELNYVSTFYRKYDAQIGRFTGVDMFAEQFAAINPYQFGGDNPVMFIDPSGAEKEGPDHSRSKRTARDILNELSGEAGDIDAMQGSYLFDDEGYVKDQGGVPNSYSISSKDGDTNSASGPSHIIVLLQRPIGEHSSGHQAVLIGNKEEGWYFYSKDGAAGPSGNCASGSGHSSVGIYFKTLAEFAVSPYNTFKVDYSDAQGRATSERDKNGNILQRFSEGYLIKTDTEKDTKMKEAASESAKSYYSLGFQDCTHVVKKALDAAGLKNGESSPGGVIFHAGSESERPGLKLNWFPSDKQWEIQRANKGMNVSELLKFY